ncbi:hypothetical protein [Fibrobacter sp. UBA3718]|uniref:hypothetical protein n=1 Tax=Fibrobacter sp. UBA3718 TaxID=1946531 RepID=UPI0025C13F05|nr:hypothetical protein [Fibrobacter sp. UBA3718]
MRINYNILWFENEQTAYETKRDFVKDILEELYFNFPEPRHEIDGSNIESIDYSKYDLIIADMNLVGNEKSMVLIDRIRNKQILTEVLFYSSAGEDALREELAKYRIDGAYCSGREDYEFEEKVRSVVETLIKKTQDLTNLRGLVMSEVSDLDVMMKQIVSCCCEENKIEQELRNYIVGTVEERIKKTLSSEKCQKQCTHVWRNKKINEVISEQNFDSYTTARALHHLAEKKIIHSDFNLETYRIEIIENRNFLAHCQAKLNTDGKEILVTSKGDKEYDSEKINDIRKNIIKYHDMFVDLLKKR